MSILKSLNEFFFPKPMGLIKVPPPHVHDWKAPRVDLNMLVDPTYCMFIMCGNLCECGAKRVYEGPMNGYSITLADGTHTREYRKEDLYEKS
jgi:hypothetical protein